MKVNTRITPEQLLEAIRQSFIGAEQVYKEGSCIMLYRILKRVFPNAKPYWSEKAKHCITEIGGKYYDIHGQVKKTADYSVDPKEYGCVYIAVAFPQKTLRKFTLTTPITTDKL